MLYLPQSKYIKDNELRRIRDFFLINIWKILSSPSFIERDTLV